MLSLSASDLRGIFSTSVERKILARFLPNHIFFCSANMITYKEYQKNFSLLIDSRNNFYCENSFYFNIVDKRSFKDIN